MSNPSFQDQFTGAVRIQQIIIATLVVCCLGFAVFTLVYKIQEKPAAQGPGQPGLPIVTYVALANAVTMLVAFCVTAIALVGKTRREASALIEDETSNELSVDDLLRSEEVVQTLLRGYQKRTIVGASLLDGGAFLCLIAYLLEGQFISFAAAGVLILGIMLQFPTTGRVARWIMDQARMIHNDRQFTQK